MSGFWTAAIFNAQVPEDIHRLGIAVDMSSLTAFPIGFLICVEPELVFYTACKIKVLPDWPKYFPDLNQLKNVWAWCKPQPRKKNKVKNTFPKFGEREREL